MDRTGVIDRGTLARHLAADVDRVAPLLARILLVRAVWGVRRNRDDHSLWVARDMAADCGGELEAAGAVTRRLARVLVPDHVVEHDLTGAVAGADRLSAAIARKDAAYSQYSVATDPDIHVDEKRADDLWKRWREQDGQVHDALGEMPKGLGTGRTGSLLLDRALDRVFKRGLYYQTRHYLFSREPERAWRRRVADVLQDAANVRLSRGYRAATDDLPSAIRAGRRALEDTEPSVWARQAAIRLEETAIPVLSKKEPLTNEKATALRLLALCLACEVESGWVPAADDPFRGVIAAITAMQPHTPGHAP